MMKCPDSQQENCLDPLARLADFGLKACIIKEDSSSNISGRNGSPSTGHIDRY
jgi:hypothetical protein